jgi:gliding motility-associated-like protein
MTWRQMVKKFLYILLFHIMMSFCFVVSGQTVMPDTAYVGQTRHYFVAPVPGSTYSWWIDGIFQSGFSTNEFEYTWNTADTYLLEVRELSGYGCAGPVRSGLVFVIPETDQVIVSPVIRKAFSPNNDGINDYWNIGNVSLYPSIEVTIYNRWGQSVWKSGRGYPSPWDGKSNGVDLPMDSYHYVIDLHNGSKLLIGDVTIVR